MNLVYNYYREKIVKNFTNISVRSVTFAEPKPNMKEHEIVFESIILFNAIELCYRSDIRSLRY